MFEKYTYKFKLKALALIFVLLLAAAYKRSFSQLIDLVKENNALTEKKKELDKSENNIKKLQYTLDKIDRIIGKETVDKEKIQQDIISFTVNKKLGISIFDMRSIHQFNDENYTIYTNQFELTGSFNDLLRLSYDFEKKFLLSRVSSMHFYTIKKSNNPTVLHLKMIFQNYENNK
ncbi:hypothetical protein ACLI09_17005 [Flavobacterium sp. RHBU_24]|uniref:hypothetical protein n=1 Tax=Flavobacterium sp. RHBU_24 TaxID=3391185 RepID=UPI003984FFB2